MPSSFKVTIVVKLKKSGGLRKVTWRELARLDLGGSLPPPEPGGALDASPATIGTAS